MNIRAEKFVQVHKLVVKPARGQTLFRTNYDACHEFKHRRCPVLLREKDLRRQRTEI